MSRELQIGLLLLIPFYLFANEQKDAAIALYEEGKHAEAYESLMPLAEQGDADAQYLIGLMYAEGQGVPQDYEAAIRWYRLATDQGHAKAQFNLGLMYDNGRGVPQDYAQAREWYLKAAEQGMADGQVKLGIMYQDGPGVLQDYVQAHMWYNLAAAQNQKDATKLRAALAKDMPPEQIAEAQRLTREWLAQHQK